MYGRIGEKVACHQHTLPAVASYEHIVTHC
jgi:hypothetical protein